MGNVSHEETGFPFFIAEVAAEGPDGGGGLFAATSRCLGGTAACLEAINKLNDFLQDRGGPEAPEVDDTVFSIAANQFTAELFVSYMEPGELGWTYRTTRVASFLLSDPDHVLKFHRCIRNILGWGKGPRLRQTLAALDFLDETKRKAVQTGHDGQLAFPRRRPRK
ncbi:hypothetical protein PG985_002711 [Apiospora marii]|uniref:uncharacterized protein n=1 Tax=Apiospora marii TaxID=335849 RepID=UPI00313149E7